MGGCQIVAWRVLGNFLNAEYSKAWLHFGYFQVLESRLIVFKWVANRGLLGPNMDLFIYLFRD